MTLIPTYSIVDYTNAIKYYCIIICVQLILNVFYWLKKKLA